MITLYVKNNDLTIEIPPGGKLIDYLKETGPENLPAVPFGCENGECGTCICIITKGEELLAVKAHKEWVQLQKMKARPGQRLCCQLYLRRDLEMETEMEKENGEAKEVKIEY